MAATPEKKYYGKLYFHLFEGLALLVVGCLLIIHTVDYASMGLWLPLTMIVLGLLTIGGGGEGLIFGLFLLLTGSSILLHETGLITVPYLRNFIGALFAILGGIMIVFSSIAIIKKFKSKDPDPEYYEDAKVDY